MIADTLDPLIHVPARLQIVATLAALPNGDVLSFTSLQGMIGLTPGNLIMHPRKLEDADYVSTEKTGTGPASRTSVALTYRGRAALDTYTETLRGLLNGLWAAGRWLSGSARRDEADGVSGDSLTETTAAANIDPSLDCRRSSMSWKLQGSYFETCSCNVVCPCTASLAFEATHDRCRVTLVFNVKKGEIEGTDVSGLTVAAVADTPKVMTDGNWRLGVFIDAAASDEQAAKLGAVFSGTLGGPMQALGPLVGESLGVERAPIEVREEGLRHSVRIGDAVDFEIEDVVPFGVETGEPARLTGIFHPAGSELTIAHATRSRIDAFGIQYEGNSGFSSSDFSWAA